MGVITVNGPLSGRPYSVRIAGDAPTASEQGRIDQFVSQQEAPYQQKYESIFGAAPQGEEEAPIEEKDRTAFGRGFVREPSQKKRAFGVAEEELADSTFGKLIGLDAERGAERRAEAEAELQRLEQEDPSVGFRDIEDAGTAASFAGEQIGSEARDLAIQTGATGVGAMFGPLGAFIGRAGGVGYTTAMAAPQLFAEAIDKQKEAGADISLGKALGATAANMVSEFIVDYFIVGKLLKPVDAGAVKRAIVEGGKGAGVEGAQEVSQSVVNRFQAGLPLDSEDALMEYAESFAGGATVGGPFAGGAAVLAGRDDKAGRELVADLNEADPELAVAPVGVDGEAVKLLAAPEPEAIDPRDDRDPQEPLLLGVTEDPNDPLTIYKNQQRGFSLNEYNAVLNQITRDGELKFPAARAAIKAETGREKVPTDVVNKIADTLTQEGKISKRGKRFKATLAPAGKQAQDQIDYLRADTEATQRKIKKLLEVSDDYGPKVSESKRDNLNSRNIPELEAHLASAKATGLDLYGKKQSPKKIESVLEKKKVLLNKLNERLIRNQEKLKTANIDFPSERSVEGTQIPASQIRLQDFIDQKREAEQLEILRKQREAVETAEVAKKLSNEGTDVKTDKYLERQKAVLKSLRAKLNKMGLKEVKLEGAAQVAPQTEGVTMPITPDGNQIIALSMGIYDPNLDDATYFRRIGDVLNHEIIHAITNLGLFTKKELQLLAKAAKKTKYVKLVNGKPEKRSYTYYDRAAKINSDLSSKKQKGEDLSPIEEEAIAEMFRDFARGKLKKVGQARSLLKRIADFFRMIVGAHVDNGFNSVDAIFGGISSGDIGSRQRNISEAQVAAKPSRIAAVEEDVTPIENIRMPIDPNLPSDQARAEIQRMTNQNRPIVKRIMNRIDSKFGTKSGDNSKDLSKVTQKAQRPSILATKPWHNVSHIRDTYRFKTVVDDFRDVPAIFDELLREGISLVKIDTNKLFEPKEWGWRIIAFDLRMPNGQLVEWYLPLKELEVEKKARGHLIFEEWRNKTQQELSDLQDDYFDALGKSYRYYDQAFQSALDRMGIDRQEAEASWRRAESSMLDAARKARSSSGVGISSGVRPPTGLTAPSNVRTALDPSAMNTIAREVPSSTRANASSAIGVTPSDIDVTGLPLERQPKFSRLARSSSVTGLVDFIKNNPDGFTISSDTYEPVSGGYAVAPLKEAEIIVGENLPEEVLLEYIQDNKDIATAIGKPVYLGGWFDSDSGQYFLDNALIMPTVEDALYIAEAADQIAIFDLNTFEEINTNDGIRKLQQSGAYSGDTAVGYKRRLEEVGRSFAEARNNRNTREKEQLVGRSKAKFSKLTVPLTQEQRDASILDYLDPETGKPLFTAKQGAETLVSFANRLLGLRNTRSYDILNSDADKDQVAQIFAAEAEAALLSSSDAIGWYDATLKLAKRVMSKIYPEVTPILPNGQMNPSYDRGAEVALDFATAVTSNGLAVTDNYDFAAKQYEALKASADGKFPVKGKGKQGGAMLAAFEFWNILTDQGYTPEAINDLLMTEVKRSEIDAIIADILGINKKDLPKKLRAKTSEAANETVSIAYLLGPKIGNGFYRNLRGNFDPITMDRWWMRFINRITGNPIKVVKPETIEKNIDDLWAQVENIDSLQEIDRQVLDAALSRLDTTKLKRSDMIDLIPLMNEIYEKDFFKKAYNDKIEELEAQGYSKADASTREIAQKSRPVRTPFLKNVGTYISNISVELQEDPRNKTDRIVMRDVTARAKKILKSATGLNITNADLQALMWYAEKRIFASGGVRKGRGEDNDYADGAIYVLKKRGVSDDEIKDTLPDSERYRVRSVFDELQADDQANASTVKVDRIEEGNFFGPRELVIEERSLAEDLTPEERSYVEEILSNIKDGSGRPPVQFSRIPSKPYSPVRAPVEGEGILAYAYGFIKEGKNRIPVILPEGSHKEFDNGTEVGQGLYHIHRRMHDKELVENSKYKRVENAIFDLMRRWQNQNFEDGESVIGYPTKEGIVLEWRDNITHSAPPLQLVLERDTERLGMPVYYVKTFFPTLEKKKRASIPHRGKKRAMMAMKYSRIPQYSQTFSSDPRFVGPNDLSERAEMIRYTAVQDKIAKYLGKLPFISDKGAQEKSAAFMTKLQDSMLPVGKMYDKLRDKYGPNVIAQDMDAYFQETLMHGVGGPKKEKFDSTSLRPTVEQIASIGVTQAESDALDRISGYYKQIRDKHGNKSHALANAYLYALHSKERNARISELSKGKIENGSGMTDAEADQIISFVNSMQPVKRDALRNVATQVQGMIRQTNEVYIDGGLIPDYLTGEDVDDATKESFTQYANYVPLRGFADPESDLDIGDTTFSSSTMKYGSSAKPNKSALGRSSYAGDIIANVAVQHHQAIDKAERNKVGQSLLKLFQQDDIDTSEFGAILEDHPMKRAMVNGTIRYVPDRDFNQEVEGALAKDGPILAVRKDGKEYLIGLEPKIAKAMKGSLSPEMPNKYIRFLHQITRLYANLLTSYNPAFLLSNWPRDIETAIFNSQQYEMKGTSKQIIKGVPKAYKAIIKTVNGKEGGDPYWRNRYQEFYENGGQNVLNQMANLVDSSKDIEKTIGQIVGADDQGVAQKVKQGFIGKGSSLLGYVEAVNSAVENSTRLAFFDAMVTNLEAQNVPKKEALKRAAFAARNLTTNFSKGGEMKNGLNALYLFFNASLQGSMAMFGSLANSKKARKLAGGIVVFGFLMDQINSAMSDDEDEDGINDYDDINDYTLGHNIVFPDLNGDGKFVKVPMAYGLNLFFNLGRITSNLTRGAFGSEGTYTPQQAAAQLLGNIEETINPFGGNNPLTFVAPTVLDLPVEVVTNKNFMSAPIYKELSPFEQDKSRSGLYWGTTSPSAIAVSKFINDTIGGGDDFIPGTLPGTGIRIDIQPDIIEHILQFMTGGVGRLANQAVDTAYTAAKDPMELWQNDMTRNIPMLNKFLTSVTGKDRAGSYYEKRDDVFAVRRSFKDAVESRDRERIIALREKYPEIIRVMEPVRKVDSAIRKLRKQIKLINSSVSLSEDRKRELKDKIDQRILFLQNRANNLMKNI